MNKWAGIIGFRDEIEEKPSVWVESITERKYYGDIVRNYKFFENQSEINDSVDINNQISIISDPYIRMNFHKMLYITYMGTKWKIKSVEVQYPRMIMAIGGLYNDEN